MPAERIEHSRKGANEFTRLQERQANGEFADVSRHFQLDENVYIYSVVHRNCSGFQHAVQDADPARLDRLFAAIDNAEVVSRIRPVRAIDAL